MEQKKVWIALLVCLVLFVGGCFLSTMFSQHDTDEWVHAEGGNVVLNEIVASNRTYPAPDGQFLDFIELHNLSENAVDISGYMISDDLDSIGYTFPAETILPPYGYAVCWCNKDSDSDAYASFGISRYGGDTIYLYNNANVLVDEKEVPPMSANETLIRMDDTNWSSARQATPGYANTQEGYRQWLASMGGGNPQIVISEIMTDNSCITTSTETQPYDWVELTNYGSQEVTLTGAYLSNDPAEPLKWQIPSMKLAAGQTTVIYCANDNISQTHAPFGLSKSGCTVVLTGILGNTLSEVACPALETDHSWSLRADGSYELTNLATPGFSNDSDGYAAWMRSIGAEEMQLVISEVMTSNHSTVLSSAGNLCDWVEITNTGSSAANLDGAYLSDDPAERGKWRISSLTIAPGESAVIHCAGSAAAPGEAAFALPKSGCTVTLSGPSGNILAQTDCPRLEDDRSYALGADGTYTQTDMPTPGFPNTEDGYLAYCKTRTPMGNLAISEVMPSNSRYMIQSDGRYYDWVELINISSDPIDLADYALSNAPDALTRFPLPRRTLAPGERITIICSANDTLVGNAIQASFTLSAEECWVYVTDSTGRLSDYMRIHSVPDQSSMGRADGDSSICYFTTPTPGSPNGTGAALVSQTPRILTAGGVFNGVDRVTVELQGAGQLYYTTDGSTPTAQSSIYTAPITLQKTTVLRAISIEQGKFPSDVATASYILNENHTLPVLSLTADPAALFGETGLCSQTPPQDAEILCNLTLFEENGGFSVDCGLELSGNTASALSEKSFKVNFRGRYGADVLGYPLYGSNGAQIFDALLIQAGRDHGYTIFRNELFETLSMQLGSSLLTQRSKFCVLYINGEYWGIRSLKEAWGEMLYAQTRQVSEPSVTALEEPVPWGSDIHTLASYCAENDMTVQENFDHAAAQLDLDSLMDWMILQGYSCNSIGDNLRYFRSPENENKWQLAFYDLDNAFFYRRGFDSVFSPIGSNAYLSLTRNLIKNDSFRQQFLERLSDALDHTLSNENVLSILDSYASLLEPEVTRDRERWSGNTGNWLSDVQRLRTFITRYDHRDLLVSSLKTHIGLTDEEAAQYFGR